MDTSVIVEKATDFIFNFGPRLLTSVLILVLGLWLINYVVKAIERNTRKHKTDEGLRRFVLNLTEWGLKTFLVITVLSQLGVATTSFVAIIGAAGLAIGLALQGSLGNFAGGVLILVFRPFRVGELIEAQGVMGRVEMIQIFITKIVSPDGKTHIIPNGALSNGNITNYSAEGKIRVDLVAGVAYDADIKQARDVLVEAMKQHPMVLDTPAPTVSVTELADSSVNLAVRPWCKPDDYWDVYFGVTELVKETLDKASIEIPYPHQIVYMHNEK